MNGLRLTDAQIRDAFEQRAGGSLPNDLRGRVIAAVEAAPQRRSWASQAAGVFSRPDRRRAILALAAVALLVAATVAIAIVGSHDQPDSSGRGIVFLSNGDMYLAGPDGRNPRLVVADLPGDPSRPTWVDADTVLVQALPGGVYEIDLAGPTPRLLVADAQLLALSPDHRRVAVGFDPISVGFERPEDPRIWIVDVASGARLAEFSAATRFGPNASVLFSPYMWSPDGRWLLGQGVDTDVSDTSGWIFRIDVQTGEFQDVAIDLCCGLSHPNPVLSPDGSRVAFVSWHQKLPDNWGPTVDSCDFRCGTLWSIELSTGARMQLTPDDGSKNGPVFSPDGTWIAFLDSDGGDAFEVAIVRPDGTGLRKLTHAADMVTHAGDVYGPISDTPADRYLIWDADGSGLTFMRGPGESHELWHVTLDGPVEQRLGTFLVSEFAR
jgi:hypothetical protein